MPGQQREASKGSPQREVSKGWPADSKPVFVLQMHKWNCEACGIGYELGSIESALVAVVQQQERAYQLQDLQCTKCRNVSGNMDVLHFSAVATCKDTTTVTVLNLLKLVHRSLMYVPGACVCVLVCLCSQQWLIC